MDNHSHNIEARISRMRDSGILSAQQAEILKDSVGRSFIVERGSSGKCKISVGVVTGLGVLLLAYLLVLSVFFGSGTDVAALQDHVQDVSQIMNQAQGVGNMNKSVQSGIGIVLLGLPVLLSLLAFVFFYNDLVSKEENVIASWSQVEAMLQRRADLVPNLVATVKGYAQHEEKIMQDTAQGRAGVADLIARIEAGSAEVKAASLKVKQNQGDDAAMKALQVGDKQLQENMRALFAVAENYPDLKASDNFLALQDQLEGTENRINVTRMLFNDTAREYNAAIRKMPGSLIAGVGNFQRKAYFEAEDSANKPVEVKF